MNTYDLVAVNWEGNCDDTDLAYDLGEAVTAKQTQEDGSFRFTIQATLLSPDLAQALATDLGFASQIESTI